jgi:glycosyltransferase involved in cell wall biosynthesis
MHLLFIHQAFPAQFGRLALELTRRYGWRCSFIIQHLSKCPTPSREMLERLTVIGVPRDSSLPNPSPWNESLGDYLRLSTRVCDAALARRELRPDLVVAHMGLGPGLFLPEVFSCPFVGYCEYYLGVKRRDLLYRADLPAVELAPFYPRCINAATLLDLLEVTSGYTPTHWQRQSFPERFRHHIEVHFDGLDTELYRPRTPKPGEVETLLGGRSLPAGTRLVTFVSRGLESMRGFDLFLKVAERIGRERSDVLFAVAGSEESYYGWDNHFTGKASFKEWALKQIRCDLSRFVFLGQIEPAQLAMLLARSDLHIYLTVPFVLSWSLFDALASGCVVLASDVPPVREVIEPGVNGLVENLFDIEALATTALRVLDDPAEFRPLGTAGRALIERRYSLDVAIPELKEYLERQASNARPERHEKQGEPGASATGGIAETSGR